MKPNTKTAIARTPVESSQIKSMGHDPVSNTLELEFSNGDVYRYGNFHADSYLEFQQANSLGSHFINRIKSRPDKFPYINMEDVEEGDPSQGSVGLPTQPGEGQKGVVQDQRARTSEQSDPTGLGDVPGSDINTPVIPERTENQDRTQDGEENDPDGPRTNRIEPSDNRTITQKAADQRAGAGTATEVETSEELQENNTIPELEKIAKKENIDLTGKTLKADIADAIVEARKDKSRSEKESPEPPKEPQVI